MVAPTTNTSSESPTVKEERGDMKMWLLLVLVAHILLVPATSFEHPGRIHHRRPPPTLEPSPEKTEFSYHSEESIPWKMQVTKRKGEPRKGSCVSSQVFTIGNHHRFTPKCKYKVDTDIDAKRFPNIIHTMTCLETGCRCSYLGDYRCTQVVTPMEVVTFSDPNRVNVSENKIIIKVNSACICAVAEANRIHEVKPTITRR